MFSLFRFAPLSNLKSSLTRCVFCVFLNTKAKTSSLSSVSETTNRTAAAKKRKETKMRAPSLLLALVAVPVALALAPAADIIAPRQAGTIAAPPAAVPTAPAATEAAQETTAPLPASTSAPPSSTPTPTSATTTSISVDIAACEKAIDTLLLAVSQLPTPNAALGAYLSTETATVTDPCRWVADAPMSLAGDISAYSSNVVDMLSRNAAEVSEVASCVDVGGASITRAEMVTPLFGLPQCEQTSTGSNGGGGATAGTWTTFYGWPTSTSKAGVMGARETGVVGVVGAAVLFGVVGVL
ncbi:hypothetical protein B0T17DRAFT_524955 [Bombardia bombarda]|uniref:Uncharacterized protein n=1 Tax=Bombardia bombarda TaxID=252184 RepID=A0AA39X8N7_9PEZI|nr:hypothetical protein B0T17DRAFT_524955 [Bombardia bombarda]